jgi:hypothetical protein
MTNESLTPNMRVLFWLDCGQWCGQGDLYKTLDRAHGGGGTVSTMDLIGQRRVRRGKYREWRKLGNQVERAEHPRKQTIRTLIIQVECIAWNREETERKVRDQQMWRCYVDARATHHFAAATHISPPTVH